MTAIPFKQVVEYPESDGQPVGETDFHRREMNDLISALEDRFRAVADVYVAGNLFLYYVQGDSRSVVCPDVFLVRGVVKGDRRIYKLWEEGLAPSLVIEVTSRHTADEDLGPKMTLYARLGIEEYFLHDPFGDYLSPKLQGYRLDGGRYRPIAPAVDGSLASATTELVLRPEGPHLRLVDPATGEPLLRDREARDEARRATEERAAREAAEARAAAEAAARRAAEEELARLRRELKLLKPGG